MSTNNVLQFSDCSCDNNNPIEKLLNQFHLHLELNAPNIDIPGSYWGESEAGLIMNTLHVRSDTPIHSLLHEACHYICMDKQRRDNLDTNAEGDYDEENAVCYLQIILANDIPEMGQQRMMKDMDRWGYTFRFGSAEKWFKEDAEDAFKWLQQYKILDKEGHCTYLLRI